jgi:hypothetical protein
MYPDILADYCLNQKDITEITKIWSNEHFDGIRIASRDYTPSNFSNAITYLHECIDNSKHRFIPWVVLYRN